jgi:hypothetical protein
MLVEGLSLVVYCSVMWTKVRAGGGGKRDEDMTPRFVSYISDSMTLLISTFFSVHFRQSHVYLCLHCIFEWILLGVIGLPNAITAFHENATSSNIIFIFLILYGLCFYCLEENLLQDKMLVVQQFKVWCIVGDLGYW